MLVLLLETKVGLPMAFVKEVKPATTFTEEAKPNRGGAGRFGVGRFGVARFGAEDNITKEAKPATTFTEEAKP